jgi:hypothetical protein
MGHKMDGQVKPASLALPLIKHFNGKNRAVDACFCSILCSYF